MKKLKLIFSLCLIFGLAFTQIPVFAEEGEALVEEGVNTTYYIKASGIVQKVEKEDNKVILTVEEEGNEENISLFFLTDDTLIFNAVGDPVDKDSFQAGQTVDFYYDKNKPMILIYPPQIYPEIVIVPDEEGIGSVKVGKFDEQFLSLDGDLKLNIAEDTVLLNVLGQEITKEDLVGEELIVFYTISTFSLPAQTTPVKIIALTTKMNDDNSTDYIKSTGVIQKVEKDGNKVKLTVGDEGDEGDDALITHFFLTDDTLILNSIGEAVNKESFQVGQTVDFYYDKNKPRILIYPAQIYPEIVIVPDEDNAGFVKVGKFDENFLSLDKELKLNISDETILLNNLGKKITKEDLKGQELIVFYTFTTKSLPPQTTPTKIIAYTVEIDKLNEVKTLIGEDYHMQNGHKMIPLRKAAEYLGYEVKYDGKTQKVALTSGKSQFIIDLGNKAYQAKDHTGYFVEKPLVKAGTTYVSEEFIYVLLNE